MSGFGAYVRRLCEEENTTESQCGRDWPNIPHWAWVSVREYQSFQMFGLKTRTELPNRISVALYGAETTIVATILARDSTLTYRTRSARCTPLCFLPVMAAVNLRTFHRVIKSFLGACPPNPAVRPRSCQISYVVGWVICSGYLAVRQPRCEVHFFFTMVECMQAVLSIASAVTWKPVSFCRVRPPRQPVVCARFWVTSCNAIFA